jgi:hypothetical protein
MEDIKGQPGEADKEASIEVARSGESQEASKDPKPAASPSEQDRKES